MQEKKFVNRIKENKQLLCQVLVSLFLPLLLCVTYTVLQGYSLFQVSLFSCDWNDELFYYKQVESILSYGYPLGYMGFNESHAISLSFAAWSPVLVWPWVLWGAVFGWHFLSPIYCNIVIYGLTLAGFVLLTRPNWKQMLRIWLVFALFTLNLRYMLSCMPEIICFSHLILFYGLAIFYERREKRSALIALFVLGFLMTWMRPYLILTLLLPAFYLIRGGKTAAGRWLRAAVSGASLLAALFVYALINHYLAAAYFTDLFYTKWLTAFFTDGFFYGVKNFLYTLATKGNTFLRHSIQGCIDGLWSGTFFTAYLAVMVLLLVCFLMEIKQKSAYFWCQLHLLFSMIAMLFALLLMYKINEGSKHLLTFIAAGIFLLALSEQKALVKTGLLSMLFVWLFCFHVIGSFDFHVTYTTPELEARCENWQQIFAEGIELNLEEQPSYDNTVIWTFSDEVDGEMIVTDWQMLYLLPAGTGISCCYREFVEEQLLSLQCRYLATVSGGVIAEKCDAAGYEKIGEDARLVVYRRY